MLFAALLACVGAMAQWDGDLAVSEVSTTPATTLEDGYYVLYNNGRGTFMNTEEALGEAKVTWPVTASAVGLAAFNNDEALTNQGAKNRDAYVFYLTLEEGDKLSLKTCYGDYVPALKENTTFSYTAEKGLWNYNFKVDGENSYLFLWSDNKNSKGNYVGLDANGWAADTHTYSTVAGWDAAATKETAGDVSSNQSWTLYKATMASASEVYRNTLAAVKADAEAKKAELEALPETAPVIALLEPLNEAIAEANANAESTDIDALNAAIEGLNAAIAMCKNISFEGGALATLENGEYVVYYVDANGERHYLASQKSTKRAVISDSPMVYDVTIGNTNGYVSYAYYFNMNGSRISNPTDDDDKYVQVEREGDYNYNQNRVWDSQVLYVNDEGKYAIRSTNCAAGSGWNSDCFITVAENGHVIGQNVDLSDALYMWNVVKASEANIAFELTVDEYKYMTLFVNYAVNVPDGAMAYAVSEVEDGELALTEVGAVIPENTPVIIEAEADNYAFTYAAPVAAYDGDNMLKGSWFDSYITPTAGYDAYVMALNQEKDEVVMGKAKLTENGGRFICRANKAYLEIAQDVAAGAAMFSFGRGEGTTAIHNSQLTIDNVVIYDLTGRRVEKMEKGVYIVNGKKVVK